MKKIVLFLFAITAISAALADHHPKTEQSSDRYHSSRHYLLDPLDCKEIKDGVGWFLSAAGGLFEDIREEGEGKNKKWNDKKWREAALLSRAAANYSTVYQVWCKHID